MNREERIEKARRMAAENAPQRDDELRKRANRLQQRLSSVGASQAQRHVSAAEQAGEAAYLGPVTTPKEWDQAVELARLVTISRAKRHDTITYGEIKWAIFDELRMLVNNSMLDLVAAVNHHSDGALLSSIIVHQDDGKPGDGFLPYAKSLGFDLPLDALQRQVYEHFG